MGEPAGGRRGSRAGRRPDRRGRRGRGGHRSSSTPCGAGTSWELVVLERRGEAVHELDEPLAVGLVPVARDAGDLAVAPVAVGLEHAVALVGGGQQARAAVGGVGAPLDVPDPDQRGDLPAHGRGVGVHGLGERVGAVRPVDDEPGEEDVGSALDAVVAHLGQPLALHEADHPDELQADPVRGHPARIRPLGDGGVGPGADRCVHCVLRTIGWSLQLCTWPPVGRQPGHPVDGCDPGVSRPRHASEARCLHPAAGNASSSARLRQPLACGPMSDEAPDPDVSERFADRVRYERTGHVATITYDRPDKLNAIDGAMRDGLNEAFARLDRRRRGVGRHRHRRRAGLLRRCRLRLRAQPRRRVPRLVLGAPDGELVRVRLGAVQAGDRRGERALPGLRPDARDVVRLRRRLRPRHVRLPGGQARRPDDRGRAAASAADRLAAGDGAAAHRGDDLGGAGQGDRAGAAGRRGLRPHAGRRTPRRATARRRARWPSAP